MYWLNIDSKWDRRRQEEDADTTIKLLPSSQMGWRSEGSWRSIFSRWSSRINAPTSHRVHHAFDFLFRPIRGSQTKSDAFSFDPTNFPRILPASIFLSIRLFFFSTIPEFRDPFVSDQDAIILDSVCKNNSYYFKVINNGNGIDLLKSVALWEQSILTTEIGI